MGNTKIEYDKIGETTNLLGFGTAAVIREVILHSPNRSLSASDVHHPCVGGGGFGTRCSAETPMDVHHQSKQQSSDGDCAEAMYN